MHFLKALLLFSTAVSAAAVVKPAAVEAAIAERDVAETNRNIRDVDSKTKAVTSSVNGWNGSAAGAIPINTAEQNLEKSIDNATSQASDETQASSADSKAFLSYVTGTLEPDINAALNALVSKKSQFAAVGLSSTVHNALVRLRSKSASYADQLIRIASNDQKSNGQAAKSRIDAAFAKALQSFP